MTGELPFVGRSDELRALRTWFDESVAGARRAVVVDGEAGVGKSRLLDAFVDDVRRRQPGTTVLRATCFQDSRVPYLPLATALRPVGDLARLLGPLTDDRPEHWDQRQLQLYIGASDALQDATLVRSDVEDGLGESFARFEDETGSGWMVATPFVDQDASPTARSRWCRGSSAANTPAGSKAQRRRTSRSRFAARRSSTTGATATSPCIATSTGWR